MPSGIGHPEDWACDSPGAPVELVCNTCGGINVESRFGFEGEVLSFSFSANGQLLGIISSGGNPTPKSCSYRFTTVGDACLASEERDARAAVSLCPQKR